MAIDKKTYKVTGMHCEGCANRVTTVLKKVEGVRSAEVSLDKEQAEVAFDTSKTGFNQLKDNVEKAGYGLENSDQG